MKMIALAVSALAFIVAAGCNSGSDTLAPDQDSASDPSGSGKPTGTPGEDVTVTLKFDQPTIVPSEQLEIAWLNGVPLIDLHRVLENECKWNIMGNEILVDHIHPTIEGHKRIAQAILEEMQKLRWIEPIGNWSALRDQFYKDHFDSLDRGYFVLARQSLKGLRAWSKGRAGGLPIDFKLNSPQF